MKAFLTLFFVLSFFALQAQVESTFDSDTDGWLFLNGTTNFDPEYNTSGGNPGGYVSYTLSASTANQRWIAPQKFLGSKVVKSLGMMLRFDLQQSIAGANSVNSGDVRITGGGITIVYSLPEKPAVAPAWTTYAIRLDETENWRLTSITGAVATRQDIIRALTNVTSLEIRGTFTTTNPYTVGLDNVILEEKTLEPRPIISSFHPKSVNVGENITITGENFAAIADDNAVYIGDRKMEVISASPTSLTVKITSSTVADFITVINTQSGLTGRSQLRFTTTFENGGRLIRASFKPGVNFPTPAQPVFTNAADLDGDGWSDIVITIRSSEPNRLFSIYRNKGEGGEIGTDSFEEKIDIGLPFFGSGGTSIADIDGDGLLDIIVHATLPVAQHSMAVYRNTSTPGNLAFEEPVYFLATIDQGTFNPHVVDVDGDGKPDFVYTHGSSSGSANFFILQNLSTPGNLEFARFRSFFGGALLDAASTVASGDMDGDGLPEIAVAINFNANLRLIRNFSIPGVIQLETPFTINATAGGIRGVHIADLDGDGRNDILWGRGGAENFQFRQNLYESGEFTADAFSPVYNGISLHNNTNPGPSSLQLADMNGDGKLDVVQTVASDVSIFENLSSPGTLDSNSFGYGIQLEGSGNINGPTIADFNGDGRPDILVARSNAVNFTIFENQNISTPKIAINTVSPLQGRIGSLVNITGENFGDEADLAMVHFGNVRAEIVSIEDTEIIARVPAGANYAPVTVTRDLLKSSYHLPFSVTFSNGHDFDENSFGALVNFTLTGADYDVDVGDIDNDGKPDIIAEGGTNGPVRVFRNTHDTGDITTSSLSLVLSTPSGANPFLFDVDQDGKLDIVAGGGILKNISNETTVAFNAIAGLATGGVNHAFADLDGDGKLDIINASTSSNLNVFYNWTKNDGAFQTGPRQHLQSVSPQFPLPKTAIGGSTVTADFDNDGLWEFAATNPAAGNVRIWRNLGMIASPTARFELVTDLPTGANPSRIYRADFDLDGKMDFLIYHSAGTDAQNIIVFHNTSSGGNITFSRIDLALGANATTATIADLDGDGRPEIIVASEAVGRISVFKNLSSPGILDENSFANPVVYSVPSARGVFTGDINRDGRPEIIASRAGNLLSILQNQLPIENTILITQQPDPAVNECPGNAVVLTVAAEGAPNLSFQWQRSISGGSFINLIDGSGISGSNTPSITISEGTATFRCLVNGDDAPGVFSITSLVQIAAPARPIAAGQSICEAQTVTLTASGADDGNFRWYAQAVGGTVLSTNSSFTTPSISETTSYFVSMVLSGCESARREVLIQFDTNPSAPEVSDLSYCAGSDVILTASGAADGEYRWYDSPTSSESLGNLASLVLGEITGDTILYVSRVAGSCETDRVAIAVTEQTLPEDAEELTLEYCTAGVYDLQVEEKATLDIVWFVNTDDDLPFFTGNVLSNFNLIADTTLYFAYQNTQGCIGQKAAYTIQISPDLSPPLVNDQQICSSENLTITASGGTDGFYRWYRSENSIEVLGQNSQLSVTINAADTSFYVSIVNDAGCESARSRIDIFYEEAPETPNNQLIILCEPDYIGIVGGLNVELNYLWFSDPNDTAPIFTGQIFPMQLESTDSTIYFLIENSFGCRSGLAQVQLRVDAALPPPNITFNNHPISLDTLTICQQNSILLSGPDGFSNYNWSNGESSQEITIHSSQNISLIVGDDTNCLSTPSLEVYIDFIRLDTPSIARQDSELFTEVVAPRYTWFKNEIQIQGANTPRITIDLQENADYRVVVADQTCEVSSETFIFDAIEEEEPEIRNAFALYPNPISDVLVLEAPTDLEYRFVLYDNLGRTVLIKETVRGDVILNTYFLAKGIYHLLIESANGTELRKVAKL